MKDDQPSDRAEMARRFSCNAEDDVANLLNGLAMLERDVSLKIKRLKGRT